jgi:hypothetical protein
MKLFLINSYKHDDEDDDDCKTCNIYLASNM